MSKPRSVHGIDLTAPGGVDALFAFHRAQFGNATMTAAPAETGTPATPAASSPDTAQTGSTPPATAATPTPPVAPPAAPAATPSEKVEDLPDWAQKIISETRAEAATNRSGKTAAEQKLDAIQKAFNPDAGDEPADPVALAESLAQRDAEAKQAKTELATYKLAGTLGADAEALLDSRTFLAKIADIDPTDTAGIKKAIEEAVNDNPKLKVVLAAPKSGSNFSGGPGESATKQVTSIGDALNGHYGTK